MEDTKLAGDGLVKVSDEGEVAGSEATLVARLLGPGQVAVLRVNADSVDLGTELAELSNPIAESIQLSRAHKSTIKMRNM